LSGRILAGLLLPEPKTSLKCSIAALVSGNKLRIEAFSTENPLLANLQVSYKFASGPSEDLQ